MRIVQLGGVEPPSVSTALFKSATFAISPQPDDYFLFALINDYHGVMDFCRMDKPLSLMRIVALKSYRHYPVIIGFIANHFIDIVYLIFMILVDLFHHPAQSV